MALVIKGLTDIVDARVRYWVYIGVNIWLICYDLHFYRI